MWTDSTNNQAPDFGPGFPLYPDIDQMIRVIGIVPGTNPAVYNGFVQQYRTNLQFGDRETCFVTEPNGIVLGPGIVDARLVGSYNGLPLFATTCCPTGGFSSSSSKSSH